MPTAASMRARWPEMFPATWDPTDAVLNAAIGEAGRRIRQPALLGDRLEDAWHWAAAHFASLNRSMGGSAGAGAPGGGTVTGPIASMAVGPVSVSFGSGAGAVMPPSAAGVSSFESTAFGREYLSILRNTSTLRIPLEAVPGWPW